jgi:uncharacterized Zn-finger protein
MAERVVPHFQNDAGVDRIEIGVREFKCIGAMPPFDHPHIFIDLGDEDEAVCGYCATAYRFNPNLTATETVPPGHLVAEESVG